jgi:hypothetical protein
MIKPICVIYLPVDSPIYDGGQQLTPVEVMSALNGWDKKSEQREEFKDYLWFSFQKQGIGSPEFQVFHPKDFTEIQFNELKQLVLAEIEKNNP